MNRLARTSLALAVALAAGQGLSHAQRPKPTPTLPPPPWANKLFMPNVERDPAVPAVRVIVQDFGTVPFGTVCAHKFTITNPYAVPLQVLDVRVECGCLKAYPPSKVLQPNESAEFAVTMDAGKFKGANAKKMFVTFGPDNVSTAELEFRATSREDVTLTPGQIDFGIVAQGAKVRPQTVALKYEGRMKNWKLDLDALRSPDGLTVTAKEASRGGLFAVTYYVTVGLKENAPAGQLTEAIQLKTNDPATPFVTLSVTATVQPPVAVIPDHVTFHNAAVGTEQQYKVLVRNNGGKPFTLKADEPADGPRVEGILPAANHLHHVTLRYVPKVAGPFRHEVPLRTSLGGPPLMLIVEGEAK